MSAQLSVCCLTSGQRPALLKGILSALRPVADEIVVAVGLEQEEDVADAVTGVADRLLTYPAAPPADRAIPWLFGSCSGRWIFNIDDDEVPAPSLVSSLRKVVARTDITHGWVPRRWLHPTPDTYLAEPPWSTEFQLRLALADERFLQFSDVFHRPVICHGPSVFLEAPLWHLDTALNPAARRSAKALAYEAERPGMRLGPLAHNTGVYVPELTPDVELAPVPAEDRAAIESALHGAPASSAAEVTTTRTVASRADVDRAWPGPSHEPAEARGRVRVDAPPSAMTAGVQQTVDVQVTNESDRVWRWGPDARPEIRLGYHWVAEGGPVDEPLRLRTSFPADLRPGETALVPVHVVAPNAAGPYILAIDLVHDPGRWFGGAAELPVEVRPRERLAVIGRPSDLARIAAELALEPSAELVVVLRDDADRDLYGDHPTVESLRSYLLRDTASGGRALALWTLARRTAEVVRRTRRADREPRSLAPLLEVAATTDALVIAGPNWDAGAAHGREWWALVTTALVWRLRGRRVMLSDDAVPSGTRLLDRGLRWGLRRLASR